MESSSYYAEKKSKFSQAKSSLVSCLGGISSTIDNIGKSSDKLSGVLICGESVGKDTLDKLSYIVNNFKASLDSLISQCDAKISHYNDLYEQALAKEREEAERAKAAQNSFLNKSSGDDYE